MAEKEIKKGDEVSWNWGSGHPSGTVGEIAKEGELSIKSNKGNTIKKNADPEDPAVHIERAGNDVVKRAHELVVEKKAGGDDKQDKKDGGEEAEADEKDKEPTENGEAHAGTKRSASAVAEDAKEGEKADGEPPAKKPKAGKASKDAKENGTAKKKPGRPKKTDAPKKQKEPKKAATATGEPRRSGRNKA
ncbi:hypothetical protein LTR66_003506 [Elasticomyces elasticus]|nr:hypothetical protein LTR66_003506 [Elasticomyces elasticus]